MKLHPLIRLSGTPVMYRKFILYNTSKKPPRAEEIIYIKKIMIGIDYEKTDVLIDSITFRKS